MSYLKDTKAELKNVKWPNRKHVVSYTIVVILLSVVIAYLLGALDYGFTRGVSAVLGNF